MKLSDALKFSWERVAQHPTDQGFPIEGTDFGVTLLQPAKNGFLRFEPLTRSWADLDLETSRKLLRSEQWEPVDPKPAMLILAEAYAFDWSDPEPPSDKDAEAKDHK